MSFYESTSATSDRPLVDALAWALDLIDLYDKFLVDLGEDPEQVYSVVHKRGVARAKAALAETIDRRDG